MNELSLHILDICQNSIKADATLIEISIEEQIKTNHFKIRIHDNGTGMDSHTLSQVSDPFFTTRTTRQVGLGISLFKLAAEQCGGTLEIASTKGLGTTVTATFEHNHIDRAPLGRIEDTIVILILNEAGIDIYYSHQYNDQEYILDTRELKTVLGDVPLSSHDVVQWIKEHVKQGIITIHKEESQ